MHSRSKPDAPRFAPPSSATPSRAELETRLRQLAESTPPTELSLGACCYEMAAREGTEEYHCPTCGARTVYPIGSLDHLGETRAAAASVRGVEISLDESSYCDRCNPDRVHRQLSLVLRLPGQTRAHRIEGVSARDLVLLREFLEGSAKHVDDGDNESALKDHLDRLRELLGIEL
jgi:hypothetical protein